MARYDNLKLASQVEGVPLLIIKAARPHIPAAFDHNRVNWDIAGPYIKEHMEDLEQEVAETIDALKKERLRKTITREDYEFDIIKQKYILRQDVLDRLKDIATVQKNILRNTLIDELPSRLVGLSQADISIELEKVVASICAEMSKLKI